MLVLNEKYVLAQLNDDKIVLITFMVEKNVTLIF